MEYLNFGTIGGLTMLLIGSIKSQSLRANHRLMLWKANDPYGRLAMLGMSIFTLTTMIRFIKAL